MTTILYFFFPNIANYPAISGPTFLTKRMIIDNGPLTMRVDAPDQRLILDNA